MTPEIAIARARRRLRLVEEPADPRRGDCRPCWMVVDRRTKSGSGVYGDASSGRDHYEKTVMFRALEVIDRCHDWHQYDWHILSGAAEDRVARMIAWRQESDEAAATVAGINALVRLMVRGAR